MEQIRFARHNNKKYINVKEEEEEVSACLHVGLFV
jgi:hypothetical protein